MKPLFLKKLAENLPFTIGYLLSFISYNFRPGIGYVYSKREKELYEFENEGHEYKKEWVFKRVKKIVEYAYETIPFYGHFYNASGFHPSELVVFEDLKKIPIIRKTDLLTFDLEQRSAPGSDSYLANTGGSSGKTLSFYISPDSMGHEWAHMHKVWQKVGFKTQYLKLTFGGYYSGDHIVAYDAARHQFNVNIYKDYEENFDDLVSFFKSHQVRYLHGYPSAIYDFALFCKKSDQAELLKLVKKNLIGVLFGSEYPVPVWRELIEELFGVESVSWYGHTERTVLAYEKEDKFSFNVFHSYGFAESIMMEDGWHLVGTSYYNFASPLIRYDTEDIIEPQFCNDLLESFQIKVGRKGEFILDKRNNKIPLTGLVYGRHHKLFDKCQFIQVSQSEPGQAEIFYVPLPGGTIVNPSTLFNVKGIDVNFVFTQLIRPIRTPGGKVKLLV